VPNPLSVFEPKVAVAKSVIVMVRAGGRQWWWHWWMGTADGAVAWWWWSGWRERKERDNGCWV
jgi:hypothetical protein